MRRIFFEYDNEPMSALTHFLGFILSLAGLILLIIFAIKRGTAWHIVGFSIFGSSLLLLYAASTIYHILPITSKAKNAFNRIDHSMIYVLIAGTYTPICLITLRGGWGWSLFGVIWGLAIIGVILKSTGVKIHAAISTSIYLIMGWLAIIAFIPLKQNLPVAGLAWLIAGGIAYSLGAITFAFSHVKFHKRWFGMHEVFHIFVMIGSFCHFWLVLNYML